MPGVIVRQLVDADIAALLDILARRGTFHPEELLVAREVLEAACAAPQADYHALTAASAGQVLGFVIFGPVPLTTESWDLYWIGVKSDQGRSGLGRALLAAAEEEIRRRGGRRLYIDTSSTPGYLPARRFYEKNGCSQAAELPDFYRPGDAKLIYLKVLD